MFWRFISLTLLTYGLYGCHPQQNLTFPTWFKPKPYLPASNELNAFTAYSLAALKTEQILPHLLYRVNFTPGQKQKIIEQLSPIVHPLLNETHKPFEFQYHATFPTQHPPFQKGWRLLSHAMIWKIESFIYQYKWNNAMKLFISTTKFGLNLTGGNVLDASLGFQIADEARRAFLPALGKLNPTELELLSSKLEEIATQKPKIEKTLLNEKESMLASLQFIQDCYQKNQLADLQHLLGNSAKEAITYLNRMKSKDNQLRPDYFQNFSQEIDALTTHLIGNLHQPASKRTPFTSPFKIRPWKRLAKHFTGSAQPLLTLNDRSIARLKLLILHTKIKQQILKDKTAPKNITSFSQEITQDPFNGLPFVYQSDGTEYKIYSVGENLRDDGGVSDETGTQPDLILEEKY